jgi:hypothetical protein
MHQRLGTQPTAAFRAAGTRVYRYCTGVYRSGSLDTLMQEERAHARCHQCLARFRFRLGFTGSALKARVGA